MRTASRDSWERAELQETVQREPRNRQGEKERDATNKLVQIDHSTVKER